MLINTLTEFITALEAAGSLFRITVPVDPLLEIAAITNRVCKQPHGGAALLFENPSGCGFAVATNLFGATERVCQALGLTTLDELTERFRSLLELIPVIDSTALDHQIAALPQFSRFAPSRLPFTDNTLFLMDRPDLTRLPFLQNWPGDGAAAGQPRYLTLAQIFTVDPDGTTPNCGVYRVQLRGACEAAIQWKAGSGAARHAELYRRAGKTMPLAIVLGGAPATLFSAMCPLPGNLDELTFSGFLRGAAVVTAPCLSVPLHVPMGAEVVIEGYVEPDNYVIEGPFGNHTGYYAHAAPAALLRISAIRCREKAIIPATVVGPPPMEDCWMAQAWERLLLALLQKFEPLIKDIHFPFEWIFHQSAIISLEKSQSGMVRKIVDTLWSLPWFSSARFLLFVSSDSKPNELSRAAWKFINVTDFTNDIYYDNASGRIALDATGSSIAQQELGISDECAALIASRWEEYRLA